MAHLSEHLKLNIRTVPNADEDVKKTVIRALCIDGCDKKWYDNSRKQ